MRRNVMRRKGSMQKDPCYNNCTDDQLIELSRGGDTAATDFLMEKYKSLVRSKARAFRLPDFGDSDDQIQRGEAGAEIIH